MLKIVHTGFNKESYALNVPALCPHCGYAIDPKIINVYSEKTLPQPGSYSNTYDRIIDIIALCTACNNHIFLEYAASSKTSKYMLLRRYPSAEPVLDLPPDIKKLFPDFWEAYRQAAVAESHDLRQLCGMGYRRALEILVKQHLSKKYPDQADQIIKEPLGHSINRLQDHEKSLARGATWLGNDFAHIEDKHPEYTVQDMKQFMKSLSHLLVAYSIAQIAAEVPRR